MATKKENNISTFNEIKNVNISKRDIINIKCASDKIEEHIGEQIKLKGALIYESEVTNKETGEIEVKPISTIVSDNNTIISSPSETFTDFVDAVIDCMKDGETDLVIEIVAKKSNNGRTFYTGKLVN